MIKEVPVSALLLQVGHIPHPTLGDAAGAAPEIRARAWASLAASCERGGI